MYNYLNRKHIFNYVQNNAITAEERWCPKANVSIPDTK